MLRPVRHLAALLATAIAVGALAACGGDGNDDDGDTGTNGDTGGGGSAEVLNYADGVCVDTAEITISDPTAPIGSDEQAGSGFPQVVDCESAEAAGVLREVEDYNKECEPGQGFESFTAADGGTESTGNFCIEPKSG